jgi:hypothetical protein
MMNQWMTADVCGVDTDDQHAGRLEPLTSGD